MAQPVGHPAGAPSRSGRSRAGPGPGPRTDQPTADTPGPSGEPRVPVAGTWFHCGVAGNPWDAEAYDAHFGFVAQHGDDLVDLLAPEPGERILDVGCGTGRHAAMIAARGAHVVGVDSDPGMLAKARADHPEVLFISADARTMTRSDLGDEAPFGGCLSNAALHWMTPQDLVLRHIRRLLGPGALFVAEMGGSGNVEALDDSLRAALADLGMADPEIPQNFFPTIGVESALLEASGFRVEQATWFRRPTPLAPGTTPAAWTRQFRAAVWALVPTDRHADLASAVDAHAEQQGLRAEGEWIADYCRLRFVARALGT